MSSFWRIFIKGMMATLIVVGVVGGFWLTAHHGNSVQTAVQAKLLASLSGYQMEEVLPLEVQKNGELLAEFCRTTENPSKWAAFFGGHPLEKPGSWIYQLEKKHPGAIAQAMKGDNSLAKELEKKWIENRNIGFYPFGMTLMLIYLLGHFLTLVVMSSRVDSWRE